VFENAIASCEVVNCKGVEIQCTGKVPSIAIDKTSGIQLYLSADSLESEIVTSKSDSMNVVIPGIDDIVELPVPEQFKTLVRNNRLVTEAVQHV
jgi:adenylyl cyclase-associated protein